MPTRVDHKLDTGTETKFCNMCKTFTCIANFNKSMKTWDCLEPICRQCYRQLNKRR